LLAQNSLPRLNGTVERLDRGEIERLFRDGVWCFQPARIHDANAVLYQLKAPGMFLELLFSHKREQKLATGFVQ
jgi:hypothetical protein